MCRGGDKNRQGSGDGEKSVGIVCWFLASARRGGKVCEMLVEAERVLGYVEYPDEVQVRGFGWSVGIVFGAKITAGELTGRVPEEEVGEFEKLPEQLITEQRDFLIRKEILT